MTTVEIGPLVALRKASRTAEAEAWVAHLLDGWTDAALLPALGDAVREQGLVSDAIAILERAVALRPDLCLGWVNLGAALQQAGRIPEAKAAYDRALTIEPEIAAVAHNLGALLADEGKWQEAAALLDRACRLEPGSPVMHNHWARVLARLGHVEQATAAARRVLALDPEDSFGARLFLAGLGAEPLPERAPDALLAKVYAERARAWAEDPHTSYAGARLVLAALQRLGAPGDLDILDAGCGTGLVGELVKPMARRLEGVDSSPEMVARAEQKAIYDHLRCGDLVAFLGENPGRYDAILAAATLIHFGDLRLVFGLAAAALRAGGLFIFTLFPNATDDDAVGVGNLDGYAQGGCFVHGKHYVARVAEAAGFTVELLSDAPHERHGGQTVMGLIVGLRRR